MTIDQLSGEIERLKESHLLLQATIESQKDILIFAVDNQYVYRNFNEAFKAATAYAYGTHVSVGMGLFESITSETDQKKIKDNVDRALSGENHLTIEEFGGDNVLYYETRYSPIVNERQEVMGVTVLSSNITARVLAEQKIMALNSELEAFSYTVAHDLRAPLRIINGYSNILAEDYHPHLDEEGKRLITVITGTVRRMSQLIEDILNFSRLGRLQLNLTKVDMLSLISEIIEEQTEMIDRNRIEFRMGPVLTANCDRNLLRHVFSNLLSNAIKYSGKKEKALIEIESVEDNSVLTYSIRDNGSGFDKRLAEKMFNAFQRFHNPTDFEGNGVGLAIVHRIIERHGGKVWAESEIEQGATFYFSLPA